MGQVPLRNLAPEQTHGVPMSYDRPHVGTEYTTVQPIAQLSLTGIAEEPIMNAE
jgi:hypothetical protein